MSLLILELTRVSTLRILRQLFNFQTVQLPLHIDCECVCRCHSSRAPSPQDLLSHIGWTVFQTVDPSNQEQLNGFVQYLEKVRNVLFVEAHSGSLIITVSCGSLKILDELWEDYCSGHLNEMAQKFLVNDEILKKFGLKEAKLTTTILEEDYRACRQYFLVRSG